MKPLHNKRGYWMRPSLARSRNNMGRRSGHLCLGPLQVNWGFVPGVRLYLTWPGATRAAQIGGRPARTVLWGGRPGIDRQVSIQAKASVSVKLQFDPKALEKTLAAMALRIAKGLL